MESWSHDVSILNMEVGHRPFAKYSKLPDVDGIITVSARRFLAVASPTGSLCEGRC